MYITTYKFNASHKTGDGDIHSHTFILKVFLEGEKREDFSYESLIKDYIKPLRGAYLNDCVFFTEEPSIENICKTFFKDLKDILKKDNWELLRIEVGDSPTHCVIGKE